MIRPLQDRVLVKRVEAEEMTASGIIIPDTAKEKPQEGEVVAVGPGKRLDNGSVQEMGLKKGDKILHSHLGTQPPVSGVVMESPVQGRGVRSTILVDVKGSEVGLYDEIGSIYTSQILKVFRDDNWLPVEQ